MFEKFRRGASKVLVFALLSVLILSFAIWGIGDMVRSVAQGPLASVGGTEISVNEFTTALQNRRQMLSRQLGQPLSPEQSRAFGIDASVLGELVNSAAISNHAKELGLKLSTDTIAGMIRKDPAFQGPDQTFSRPVFDERMRQAGFTEQRYIAERRSGELREQLTEALTTAVAIPDAMVDLTHRFREETLTIQYMLMDAAKAPKSGEPDEKALKGLYEQQKATFSKPERRSVAVLLMSPADLKDRAQVSDADVKQSWEQGRVAWDLPERRRLQQIFFKTKPEAEGEAKAIEGGKSFLMAALEANGAQGRLDQGMVAQREISDPTFAKAAFALAVNKISEPIKVRGGYLLVRVTEVEPARTRTFEEVKDEVRKALEASKLREMTTKLHDDIEDRRGSLDVKEKLKKIAADLKLKLIEATDIDANGKGADGSAAITLPDAQPIVAAAFEGDQTTPREVLTLPDGSEAWLEVVSVTPPAVKAFDEVKADVEKLWREREAKLALAKESQALADRIKAGASLESVAKELGLKVETSKPFKRSEPADGISAAVTRQAFTLAKGGAGNGASADDKTRAVFVVTEIKVPEAPAKEAAEAIRKELAGELQRDALQTYVAALRTRQGVTINDAVYRRATGADQAAN